MQNKQSLQNNNYRYILALALALGIVGALLFLILFFVENIEIDHAIGDATISTLYLILLALSLWFPSNYMNIDTYSWGNLVFNNFLVTAITSFLWIVISYITISSIYPDYEPYYYSTLLWRFTIGTLLIVIIIILNYVIIFYNNLTNKVVAESKFNNLITEAELKSLKYQINPHFIFNSLNSISSLTITNPEKAQEMTINLSDFLRKILAANDVKKVSIEEELKNIELYLKIEKVRFENRLEFVIDISDSCKRVLIPNMILQPLIENSIKHGVYESLETINVNLKCERIDNYLNINISNNFDSTTSNKKGEGIGLQNINSRLKLIYNKSNLISIQKKDNIFTVKLLIPIEEV